MFKMWDCRKLILAMIKCEALLENECVERSSKHDDCDDKVWTCCRSKTFDDEVKVNDCDVKVWVEDGRMGAWDVKVWNCFCLTLLRAGSGTGCRCAMLFGKAWVDSAFAWLCAIRERETCVCKHSVSGMLGGCIYYLLLNCRWPGQIRSVMWMLFVESLGTDMIYSNHCRDLHPGFYN